MSLAAETIGKSRSNQPSNTAPAAGNDADDAAGGDDGSDCTDGSMDRPVVGLPGVTFVAVLVGRAGLAIVREGVVGVVGVDRCCCCCCCCCS